MHLTGLAGSDREVAQYLANLGASPLFKDVNLVISEAYIAAGPKAANIRRFQIQLALKSDGNVELPIRSNAQSTAALVE
jgi:Tfp pilus assembly protein PilN